jgi:L-2-hydroxyglutarate oxidase LhgO
VRKSGVWHVELETGEVVRGRSVFNCAGLYGDVVDRECLGGGGQSGGAFTIFPRKGQFVVYGKVKVDRQKSDDDDGMPAPDLVLQPVPTQRTKGVIVWTSMYGNIVVGPTAEEQMDREDRSNDEMTIGFLRRHGEMVLPCLVEGGGWEVVGTYSGIRPATEHRDYQIRCVEGMNWMTVGGIRSTGLTGASGIAEYVVDMHEKEMARQKEQELQQIQKDQSEEMEEIEEIEKEGEVLPPYLPSLPLQYPNAVPNPSAPTLTELASDYFARNDGQVECFGRVWKVTHPLSRIGMETLGQERPPKRRKGETLRLYKVRFENWQRRKRSIED